MRAGDTYVICFDHTGPQPHLWNQVTEPDAAGKVILVSITTLRHDKDQTVVLQPGDHPWIRKPSCVYYIDAQSVDLTRLSDWVQGGLATPEAPCSPQTLRLIAAGLRSSEFTPRKILRLLGPA